MIEYHLGHVIDHARFWVPFPVLTISRQKLIIWSLSVIFMFLILGGGINISFCMVGWKILLFYKKTSKNVWKKKKKKQGKEEIFTFLILKSGEGKGGGGFYNVHQTPVCCYLTDAKVIYFWIVDFAFCSLKNE